MKNSTFAVFTLLSTICISLLSTAEDRKNIHKTQNTVNKRPVIGVLSQKVTEMLTPDVIDSDTYIASSYVKYLEGAGAEVVPILPRYSTAKIKQLMKTLNGVLLPGGSAPMFTSGYYKTARKIFDHAMKTNDGGTHFPLWGTCLGFETLHNLVGANNGTEHRTVLSDMDAVDLSLEVNFTVEAITSRLFKSMPPALMTSLETYPSSFHFHEKGLRPVTYKHNKKLRDFFTILTTNFDRKAIEFVSTVEAKNYPFYATQWHPEKNIFEWNTAEKIDHSPNGIFIAQHLANFFVMEARKNHQQFESIEVAEEYSMFKYAPKYSGRRSHFEQVYVFGKSKERIKGKRRE